MGRVVRGVTRFVRRKILRPVGGLLKKGLKLVKGVAKFALPIIGLAAPFLLPGVGGALTGLLAKFGGTGGLFGGLAAKAGSLFSGMGGLGGLTTRVTGMFSNVFGKGTALRGMFSNGLTTMRGWGSSMSSWMQKPLGQAVASPWGGPPMSMTNADGVVGLASMGMTALPMLSMLSGPQMSTNLASYGIYG